MPRFDYENHVRALIEDLRWPNSTVDISELRLVIDYQRHEGADRTLTLDIVDYPGEWLLDLPLLTKSYEQWSAESLALSREGPRAPLAAPWHAQLVTLKPEAPEDEQAALASARLFTEYLRACRDERFAMSLLPPGRFLMPGNLAGSPALTFAPLELAAHGPPPEGSLWAMMVRRYEAYKDVVVRPFFRDHFSRLDRQIVLVDALAAFNAGPEALRDLEAALAGVLDCFRIGRSTLLSSLFRPRIDRICSPRPRLITCTSPATIVSRRSCGGRCSRPPRARSIRCRRSMSWRSRRCAPHARPRCNAAATSCPPSSAHRPPARAQCGETFDGKTEVATFPGDLPADPEELFKGDNAFRGLSSAPAEKTDFRFLRFRPPQLDSLEADGPALPHIRLDRALQFLIGDKLQ